MFQIASAGERSAATLTKSCTFFTIFGVRLQGGTFIPPCAVLHVLFTSLTTEDKQRSFLITIRACWRVLYCSVPHLILVGPLLNSASAVTARCHLLGSICNKFAYQCGGRAAMVRAEGSVHAHDDNKNESNVTQFGGSAC